MMCIVTLFLSGISDDGACASNPCLNNGTCLKAFDLSHEPTYNCDCDSHHNGSNCENQLTTGNTIHIMITGETINLTTISYKIYT